MGTPCRDLTRQNKKQSRLFLLKSLLASIANMSAQMLARHRHGRGGSYGQEKSFKDVHTRWESARGPADRPAERQKHARQGG